MHPTTRPLAALLLAILAGSAAAAGAVSDQALVSGYLADNPNLSAGALSAARRAA